MARRRKYKGLGAEDPGLDMSSLIDVSFLLLIYFIATSSLKPVEADLNMALPTSDSSSSDVEIDQMNINLNGQGMVVVNDEVLDTDVENRDMPLLYEKLQIYAQVAESSGDTPVVILSADDSAKGQRFVDVLNTLAKVGIKSVTLSGFSEVGG